MTQGGCRRRRCSDKTKKGDDRLFLLVPIVAGLLLSLLLGGDPRRLADVRLRLGALSAIAVVVQVVLFTLMPGGSTSLHVWAHLTTYVIALVFVIANIRIPGLWIIGLGGASNALAIGANGGVMPASEEAVHAAGLHRHAGFVNSGALAHPHLSFLGDIFAIPARLPLHNVFSIGDLFIATGIIVTLVIVSGAGRAESYDRVVLIPPKV
jgi:hypothetical protein